MYKGGIAFYMYMTNNAVYEKKGTVTRNIGAVHIWAAMPWRDIPSKSGHFFSKFDGSPRASFRP